MAYATDISAETIRQFLDYEPATGIFTWKPRDDCHFASLRSARTWNSRFAGKVAGTIASHGYVFLVVQNHRVAAHRAAMTLSLGEAPRGEIDHINGDRRDNRICNLRVVDTETNRRNAAMPRTNTSGAAGVNAHQGKWRAFIRDGRGGSLHLGSYETQAEAVAARRGAAIALGFHENHGRIPVKRV